VEEIFEAPKVIEAFNEYKEKLFPEKMIWRNSRNFEISPEAIKQNKKFFKTILKLDKNFHVYVHGNNDLMDKGFDEAKG